MHLKAQFEVLHAWESPDNFFADIWRVVAE